MEIELHKSMSNVNFSKIQQDCKGILVSSHKLATSIAF